MTKSLALKFHIKVKLGQKVGRKRNVLSEQENQRLLNGRDKTYTTPGKRIYLGKFSKMKMFLQKCYLLWIIRDTMDMTDG